MLHRAFDENEKLVRAVMESPADARVCGTPASEGRPRFTRGAGSSAFTPRGIAHTFQYSRVEAAHIPIMATPAGLDRFFEDVTALNKEGIAESGALVRSCASMRFMVEIFATACFR